MLVPQLLLETLEDLGEHDYMKFKWYLAQKVLNSHKKIAKCYLESPHRHDTVSKMIERFGEEMAVNITIEILRKMKHNNAADELMKTYTEGGAAEGKASLPLVTSSPALSLPTAQRISADGARGAIAPMVLHTTNCTVTINGNIPGPLGKAPPGYRHNHYYKH